MSEENNLTDEDLMIEKEFEALIDDYMNTNHRRKVELIRKAFNLAKEAHKGARRRSGEPYIMHPIAVARIVCKEIGLGSTSICSALLHDVVEDTSYTVEDIRILFGDKIANIVDGLTKIASSMFGDQVSSQAENFKKLLLTMSDDIRVILVKIADRLHNMRTLGSMVSVKQYKIAGETMYIYAPLSHRLGLFAIKTELEELSFKYENPETYKEISQKLEQTHTQRNVMYEHFVEPLTIALDQLGINYEIKARQKSVFSIWNKMHSKKIPFEEIYDLFAVRIIFECEPGEDEKKRCLDIYSKTTDIYTLNLDRTRDWVSCPKANGYQALHITVMGPDGQWVEVQIRSRRMDEIAEKGFAAHWKYKEGKIEEDNELEKWLKTIKEVLENPNPNAMDFLDTVKLNLFTQEIFIFTPKGELKTMPHGTTALDFAYELHSDLGDHCIGAKVNHKLTPFSQKLKSGDQVEVLTSKSQSPSPDWLAMITTAKARTKIEYALRKKRKELINQGEIQYNAALAKLSFEPSSAVLNRALEYFRFEKKTDFFYAIANKDIDIPENILKQIDPKKENSDNFLIRYVKQAFKVGKKGDVKEGETKEVSPQINKKEPYQLVEDAFKKNFKILHCCNPISGDKAFGFVNDKNEVEVHSMTCPVGVKLKASFGDRIIDVEWGDYAKFSFLSTIIVRGIDEIGMINNITRALSLDSINIKSLNIESDDGIFEGKIAIFVHSVNDVQKICSMISKIKGIKSVNRLV